MSPVFRHGGLRLYLLKLLDEAPRHGYDVIRLLQDRFMGVYSPSPGTIYPRLARLEEEGLVTHEVIDGKKVYKITDAGREELNRRFDDLADLESELTASVRDIARELSRDVRETVRSLRDEFTWAVRETGRPGGPDRPGADRPGGAGEAAQPGGPETARDPGNGRPEQQSAERVQARADRIQAEADQAQARADQAQAAADGAQAAAHAARHVPSATSPGGAGRTKGPEDAPAGSAWSEAAAESLTAGAGDAETGGQDASARQAGATGAD
ncbi:MAG: helix-turn-helix transcriptional regulator, partial [Streptosporangiaceae bacterium]